MKINQKILYETFVADFYETNKIHLSELQNLAEQFSKKFNSDHTKYINAYINLLLKQLTDKVSKFIETIISTSEFPAQLDSSFQNEALKYIDAFLSEEYNKGKQMLKAVMASLAMEHDGISAVYIGEYSTKYEQVVQLAHSKLKYNITKHNLSKTLY